jgi:hypothetical protein
MLKFQSRSLSIVGFSLLGIISLTTIILFLFLPILIQNNQYLPGFIQRRLNVDIYSEHQIIREIWMSYLWVFAFFLALALIFIILGFLPRSVLNTVIGSKKQGFIWLIVIIGALLRIRAYLEQRSLWLDESFVALNIQNQSLLDLISGPLEYVQVAPFGFLVVESILIQLSSSEISLRFLPFIGGLGLLFLAGVISQKYLENLYSKLFFASLFAFSPVLIYYSQELKQYSLDAFISLIAIFIWISKDKIKPLWIGLIGFFSLFFSQTALIVFGVLAVFIFFTKSSTGFKLNKKIYILSLWLLGASVQLLYTLQARNSDSSELLTSWWKNNGGFPNWGEGLISPLVWSTDAIASFFWLGIGVPGRAGPESGNAIGLGLILSSPLIFSALRYQKNKISFPATLVLVGFLLGVFQLYPFSSRLIIFLLPFLFFILAVGLENQNNIRKNLTKKILLASSFILITIQLLVSLLLFAKPNDNWDMKWALGEVDSRWKSGDILLTADPPIVEWYLQQTDLSRVLLGKEDEIITKNPTRIWVISTHAGVGGIIQEIGPDYQVACASRIADTDLILLTKETVSINDDEICDFYVSKF